MSTKLIIGPIDKGYTTNRLPFNIDNDSFPKLINAYQWRGRIKRKRGTKFLNRLTKIFGLASIGVSGASPWTINTIYSTYIPAVTPEPNATIKPGSVVIEIATNPIIRFVDQGNGTLSGFKIGVITNATQTNPCEITSNGHTLSTGDIVTISGVVGMGELNGNTYTITVTSVNTFTLNGVDATGFDPYISDGEWISPSATNFGTINYLTGVIVLTHTAEPGVATTASFAYFPTLPVMGLEDYIDRNEEFVQTIAFDTIYAYNLLTVEPYSTYSISYYKNPPTGLYPGYVQKTTWTPLTWNGQDYQQFWSTNYEGAFWATNGIEAPFDPTNVGMQFAPSSSIAYVSNTATTLTVTIAGSPLVIGDFVFVNEWTGTKAATLNFQSGYVTAIAPNIVITFPDAALGAGPYIPGIIQYLTNRSDITKDNIRWYDGDPTNGSIIAPGFTPGRGWVNFMPPLSQNVFSIGDAPARIYYLVGAKSMLAFKDRLVFFSPVIQTSSAGSQIYLEDTVLYSQNGTPFYTASFTGDVVSSATTFTPILVPINQIASPNAWFCDQTGFGGYIDSGLDESINTVGSNEDVLILGFDTNQVRMVYTGNDIVPFNLFVINSELGATSTFSTINMDQGVITRGNRGYTITNQTSSQRIDLDNPDQVFEIANVNNGTERFCAQRDFINEWIYFTYPSNQIGTTQSRFPTETFQYNHRDNTWAIFKETYTTYGAFRKKTGFIWATVGLTYPTWSDWNDPWDAGNSTLLQQTVIAGNQQGFVILRATGTGEGKSLAIANISGSIITSPDHSLNLNDFIIIEGVSGTAGQYLNGRTFSVSNPSLNNFTLNPTIPSGTTYTGGGTITRLFIPQIQTKQFPVSWGMARKTRIGVQQYLLSKTPLGQITLYIYLSTDDSTPYNFGPIVPEIEPENSSLVYSTVLNTCPESTNMGLTPANTNLQQLNLIGANGQSSNNQQQIWHRINTSLLGDTIQLGFTLSESQMRSLIPTGPSYAITDVIQDYPTLVETTGNFGAGSLVKITGVQGMTELNFDPLRNNYYYVISSTTTETILDLDSTVFDAYTSGGTIVTVANFNATEEIELHGMILDLTPSGLLS